MKRCILIAVAAAFLAACNIDDFRPLEPGDPAPPFTAFTLDGTETGSSELLGEPYSIHQQWWPEADAALAADELVTLVVQVNGKVRGRVEVAAGIDQPEAERLAGELPNVAQAFGGREPRRVISVAGKLINFVV